MASRQLLIAVKTATTTPVREAFIHVVSRGLSSKSVTAPRPPTTSSQKQVPKKKVVHVQKTPVDHGAGDTRLRALFSRPSTSKAPAPLDETTLLKVIRPVYDKDPQQLDPFLYDIATNLSPPRARPATDEQYITSVLAYCWVRANEIKSDRFTSGQLVEIARRYARRLVRLAIDSSDSSALLDNFEENLKKYRTQNFLLPPAIYAAWAVLRHGSGQKEIAVRFIPAKKEMVFKAFRDLLENQNERFERYTPAIEELLRVNEGGIHDLPSGPDELDSMLGAMRIGQQTEEVVRLWAKYKERLRETEGMAEDAIRTEISGIEAADTGEQETKTVNSGISNAKTKGQDETTVKNLASFLRFFSRSSATRRLPAEERDLATYRQEVLSFLPKPYPPSVHHALLVHHARMDNEIRPSSEVRELDDDVLEIRDWSQVYSQLEATWAAAGREGARDLKSYMLYIEGLAKLGEAKKLGQTWEELVRDQACKEMYLREEVSGKYFPPTRALNHMISCAFLIPDEGSSIALDLFAQATQSDSAIPCNIITINTVLRHYARRGVVDSMLALFPLAEKLKLRPDVVTYTVLIQGLLRAREIKMAAKTLETMQKQGIPPNERTISLLISDLAKEGDRRGLRAAEDLMKEMRRLNMRVGEVPWTSLISGYFRGGWDGDAWTAIKRMEDDQVALNRVGYNMVLRELGKRVRPPRLAEEGHSLLWEMFERMIKRVKPNADTYLIVLIPLVRAKRWDEADKVVKDMKDRGFVPEKSALRAVLNRVKLRKTQWD